MRNMILGAVASVAVIGAALIGSGGQSNAIAASAPAPTIETQAPSTFFWPMSCRVRLVSGVPIVYDCAYRLPVPTGPGWVIIR